MWTTQTLGESRSKHVLKRSVDAVKQLAVFRAVIPISKKRSASSTKSPTSMAFEREPVEMSLLQGILDRIEPPVLISARIREQMRGRS